MFTAVVLLAASAALPAKLPPFSLSGDTIPVPYTAAERRYGGPEETRVVFLNFDGQTLNCEGDYAPLNNSRLACPPQELSDIPPFSPAGFSCGSVAACKETIRARLVQLWADWNVRFVTERPEDGDYEMAMIGGTGATVAEGVLGIAPLDCNDQEKNSVSFSFAADIAGSPCPEDVLVTTVSHEIGHALGLCHNNETSSIMYPAVNGCDQEWTCGAQADECMCGTYCPPDHLDAVLGPAPPDTEDPTVHILSPLSGIDVPSIFALRALARDNRTLAALEVIVNDSRVAGAPPDVSGEYEWSLPAMPRGHARICVVGRDEEGNEGSDCVNVTVDPGADCVPGDCCCGTSCCDPEASCDCAGRLPNGEPCDLDQDCRGGLCEDDPWDEESARYCTEGCAEDAECPPGMACAPGGEGGRGQCWSYVADGGLGRPCKEDRDCDQALLAREGGACLDAGFCSYECGAEETCPSLFTCADVGGARHCRFVGAEADVAGGCAVGARSAPAIPWIAMLSLIGLASRWVLHPRGGRGRRGAQRAGRSI